MGGAASHIFGITLKKILQVDYPRGRAKGYYTNLISAN